MGMSNTAGPPSDRVHVTVAVPTYRRPVELDALLGRVLSQADELDFRCDIKIIIVDNDPDRGGRLVVGARRDGRLLYVHEPRPGVAAVRNRALREAWAADVIIFIDDDQLPGDGWLDALIGTWQSTGGTAVAGPVVSELPDNADTWIDAGGFFDRSYRRSLRTGDHIDEVATTNLLLDMAAIRSRNLFFDERFGLSGGEDSLFTRMLTRSGGAIVWSAEAKILEKVPAQRLSRSWVRGRAISSGNGAARVGLALESSRQARLRVRGHLLAAGLSRCAAGALGMFAGLMRRSEPRHGRSTRTFYRGLGMWLGCLGLTYLEYTRDGKHWQLSWESFSSPQSAR